MCSAHAAQAMMTTHFEERGFDEKSEEAIGSLPNLRSPNPQLHEHLLPYINPKPPIHYVM